MKKLLITIIIVILSTKFSFGISGDVITKPNLRVLDIGNSYTLHATQYLRQITTLSGSNTDDMCLYQATVGNGRFKDWYMIIDDLAQGTTKYSIKKVLGGLSISTRTGDFEIADPQPMVELLSQNEWDLIIIHQQSAHAPYYDNWSGDGLGGYFEEFYNLLKQYQPNAAIGFYIIHSYAASYSDNKEEDTFLRWELISNSVKQLLNDYKIDFILPYGTAIENIRHSSLNNENDLTFDGVHLANGFPRYAAACCYYESLIAPRSGISIKDNTFRYKKDKNQTDEFDVTDENVPIILKAVELAMKEPYRCFNPETMEEIKHQEEETSDEDKPHDIYLPNGMRIKKGAMKETLTESLPRGIFVMKKKKFVVKR